MTTLNRLTDEEVRRIANALLKVQRTNPDDMRKLALADGVLETAVPDAIRDFKDDGSESFVECLARAKLDPNKAHRYPPPEPGDGIDPTLIEAACGSKPTLAARAALRAACIVADGPRLYDEILSAWDCSEKTLVPGKNPKAVDASKANEAAIDQRRKDHSGNPFHRSQWNISKQGALVKSLGLEKTNQIAKSVGSHVGATRPNPDF